MGFKVIITESATEDLSQIVSYAARNNSAAAMRLGYALLARFQVLERYPFFGRVLPEHDGVEWRELIYKKWRLIYRVDERNKIIHAARIWHGARGLPELPDC